MESKWKRLVDFNGDEEMPRGTLFKFPAIYPFEDAVVMMLCMNPGNVDFPMSLVAITGYKAGINPYQNLPGVCITGSGDNRHFDIQWLIMNWSYWVYPDCDVGSVLVRNIPLNVDEI
ncbi:Imm45 family immunity protein [Vogesella amnigena]|uniref:Imm45 family immunity protein n=1 Tax=Vogesella amnigena TaxID=1507449 RepID=A0ABV7TXK0_9NEIS